MRTYEIMFILRADLPEEEMGKVIAQMEGVITSGGGTLHKTDRMGRRRLAYRIGRHAEGYYVLFVADCEVPALQELERRLKVSDAVIKFLTVRIDEETKRVEKLQSLRAKRVARKKPRSGEAAAASA